MAEIKSTLDLVMERTRHLTLSAEEKREQALAELKKNLSGLLLRHLEGMVSQEQFRKELHELQERSGLTDPRIFIGEVLQRFDLDQDNGPLLTLLAAIYGCDTTAIAQLLEDYRDTLAASAHKRQTRRQADLAHRHGISGSAVAVNLEADADWASERAGLRRQFEAQLSREADRLLQSTSS